MLSSARIKGCPYDNAVAEATFKIIKTEFVRNYHFESLEELNAERTDYVNWFNKKRIHSTLGYLSLLEYKLAHLKKTDRKIRKSTKQTSSDKETPIEDLHIIKVKEI